MQMTIAVTAALFLAASVSSCGQSGQTSTPEPRRPPAASASDAIDVVGAFALGESARIEIDRTMPPPEEKRTIADAAVVRQVVDALRGSHALRDPSRCMAEYRVTFVRKDGSAEPFFVSCQAGVFSGNQRAWNGREAAIPKRVVEILRLVP